MNVPIPKHLKNITVLIEESIDDNILRANIRCKCGGTEFQLLYPGETIEYQEKKWPCSIEVEGHSVFVIKAICSNCKTQYLIFDADFHGWDGVMCHNDQKANFPRPSLVPWKCLSCGNLSHKIEVKINFESKKDFIEQSGSEFELDKWPDAFQWIWISIICTNCGLETKDWVDYETA
jgi:hypothetical protein